MKIAITGSTGLVGEELVRYFRDKGFEVARMIRPETNCAEANAIEWDAESQRIDLDKLDGQDVVIHLAGANIAGHRWTEKYKELMYQSRVTGTQFLSASLAKCSRPPRVFFSASAVGYYGSSQSQTAVDEAGTASNDYLGTLCRFWEKSTEAAERAAIPVVRLRFGVVLSDQGGALAKMLPPFQWGLGGKIGTGHQYMSWIYLPEIPHIIEHVMEREHIIGAVNVVSPNPVTNKEFTKTLGKAVGMPTLFPMPAFAAKLAFGEMADYLLLNGQKVMPRRLEETGYKFRFPDLEAALTDCLAEDA